MTTSTSEVHKDVPIVTVSSDAAVDKEKGTPAHVVVSDVVDPKTFAPFSFSIKQMQDLVDPKNPELLASLGGIDGICKGLHVNPEVGLHLEDLPTEVDADEVSSVRRFFTKVGSLFKTAKTKNAASAAAAAEEKVKMDALANTAVEDINNETRRKVYGVNRLPPPPKKSLFSFIWMALQDKILILLICAAVASLGFGLYKDLKPEGDKPAPPDEAKLHWVEGFSIMIAVIIVVLAGSINDYQKEKQFQKLNAKKDNRKVKALREGQHVVISVYHILVGDVLLLEPGDVIAADGVFLNGSNLRCDESAATGESDAIRKGRDHDQFLISGAKVIEGVGQYVITAVGEHSFHGKTMIGLRTENESTPLQVKLNNLAETIAKLGSAAAALMFVVLLLKYIITAATNDGFNDADIVVDRIINIIIATVTIVVVAVPEGLPLAVTLALAYAMIRMQKDNNLVRIMAACETMAGATVICSDKTGTLTQNKMSVVKGALGRTLMFEDASEISELKSLASDLDCPGLSGGELVDVLMENISINSSAFDGIDEQTGEKGIVGSKTECALLGFAARAGYNYNGYRSTPFAESVQVYPFSSERKNMATIIKVKATKNLAKEASGPKMMGQKEDEYFYRIFVKGASEIVLKCCENVAILPPSAKVPASAPKPSISLSNGLQPLTPLIVADLTSLINKYAEQSLRTICLAYRDVSKADFEALLAGPLREKVAETLRSEKKAEYLRKRAEDSGDILGNESSQADDEQLAPLFEVSVDNEVVLGHMIAATELTGKKLTCLAIVGIEDPLRPGVPEAVRACQKAGVSVRMVTGDNVLTAKSIAARCGIYNRNGIVLEGSKFRALPQAQMDAIIPRLQVLARSSPTDKQLLVSRLKAMNETVAVTGDGTNDGPALKMADVGFSMGIAGTEVAKEASSIILMDDNFSSIVKAIMWGRCVNDSVKKFLQFQLTVNVTAVTLSFISAAVDKNESSVLTAVQLLWVNLIMDTLAALALATDAPTAEILDRPPDTKSMPLITFNMWKMILGQAVYQITVGLVMLFAGPTLLKLTALRDAGGVFNTTLDYREPGFNLLAAEQKKILRAFIFNAFVYMQIFNMINCRTVRGELNVFSGIFKNPLFCAIWIGINIFHVIVFLYAQKVVNTYDLPADQWGACVLIGFFSLIWGLIIRLIPEEVFFCCPGFISRSAGVNEPNAAPLSPAVSTSVGPVTGSTPNAAAAAATGSNAAIDPSHIHLTPEQIQARRNWANAISTVRTGLSVYSALRGGARLRSSMASGEFVEPHPKSNSKPGSTNSVNPSNANVHHSSEN